MWSKVELVKYCFDNGDLTITQIKRYVATGTLTEDEFKSITGEDYVVAQEINNAQFKVYILDMGAKVKKINDETTKKAANQSDLSLLLILTRQFKTNIIRKEKDNHYGKHNDSIK